MLEATNQKMDDTNKIEKTPLSQNLYPKVSGTSSSNMK